MSASKIPVESPHKTGGESQKVFMSEHLGSMNSFWSSAARVWNSIY